MIKTAKRKRRRGVDAGGRLSPSSARLPCLLKADRRSLIAES